MLLPQKADDKIFDYIIYFGEVVIANKWSDEKAVVNLAGMLEVGFCILDDMEDSTIKNFERIKDGIVPKVEYFREAEVQIFFYLAMKKAETV